MLANQQKPDEPASFGKSGEPLVSDEPPGSMWVPKMPFIQLIFP
jgi:hypothetical protein